jgi:DAACS family dicarboxylate/amino acid:cation (Na+ or H+) symporter
VLIGVGLVNLVRPGDGISPELRRGSRSRRTWRRSRRRRRRRWAPTFFVNLVPSNPVRAMADSGMLAVMTFALLLGVGLVLTRTDASAAVSRRACGAHDVTMRLLDLVIRAWRRSASRVSSSR